MPFNPDPQRYEELNDKAANNPPLTPEEEVELETQQYWLFVDSSTERPPDELIVAWADRTGLDVDKLRSAVVDKFGP